MTAQAPMPVVRDAGTAAMTDPVRDWDALDDELDQSFPASDPPSHSPLQIDRPRETQRGDK